MVITIYSSIYINFTIYYSYESPAFSDASRRLEALESQRTALTNEVQAMEPEVPWDPRWDGKTHGKNPGFSTIWLVNNGLIVG